ncbi:hypothetical protein ACOMHN_006413 [Nucella lapillus]
MGIVAGIIVMIALGPQNDPVTQLYQIGQQFGQDPVHVFKGFDLNQDYHISTFEFKDLIPHIKDMKSLAAKVKLEEDYPEYAPSEGEEVLVVHAHFSPLHLKQIMTLDALMSFDITGQRTLHGLENWSEANRKHEVFGVIEFKALLPENMEEPDVGLPYPILQYDGLLSSTEEGCGTSPRRKDNSRKFVPRVPQSTQEKLLFRLLAMMHPRPFLNMRFHPRGTVACVQAFNDKYVHIVLRMHAEFQLSEVPANPFWFTPAQFLADLVISPIPSHPIPSQPIPSHPIPSHFLSQYVTVDRMHAEFQLSEVPADPFWFTPAQFLADLVISRDGSHVHYFHMEVPNERKLNVDMEWMLEAVEGHEGMEVDIGYLPLMEFTMGGDSHLPLPGQSIRPDLALPQAPGDIAWREEIPREETLRLLEMEFFEFKKVPYHNLTQAVRLSKAENKPLHAIFLWGTLDDQSC